MLTLSTDARISYMDENHDLAIARSSSSCADPGMRVAFETFSNFHATHENENLLEFEQKKIVILF